MSGLSNALNAPSFPRKRESSGGPGSPLSRGRRILTNALSAASRGLLQGLIGAYQLLISPLLMPACRFEPSCSHYAQEAIAEHGALRGLFLTLKRLSRCHPWGGSGYDPVPPHTDH
ncbi:MAG TPA: membrane protein insertion efficiency factor YidD [Stellaceae bacterium]|nr:membrane protein insertion efficiency factor YidD [Stellaceae bacterium]